MNKDAIHTQVYEAFMMDLMNGMIRPGERLGENSLASRWGVGRVPVREALMRLEYEGFVERKPKVGTFVRQMKVKDLFELFDLRIALEPIVARRVTKVISEEQLVELEVLAEAIDTGPRHYSRADVRRHSHFHTRLMEIADMRFLSRMLSLTNLLSATTVLHAKVTQLRGGKPHELTQPDHRTLMVMIRDGDPDVAALVMREHIEHKRDAIRDNLRQLQMEEMKQEFAEAGQAYARGDE